MFAPLESVVLATLAYTDQFHYPLSALEVQQRLLSSGALKTLGMKVKALNKQPSVLEVSRVLDRLVKQKKLVKQDNWYSLHSADTAANFKLRKQRSRLNTRRQPQFQQLVQVLRQVPWVWGIALTGSSAMANAPAAADIDVLIVTAPGRLWLARAVVLGLSWWHKQRGKNGWCFNLWLEPTELALAPEKQGVYEAYELWQCRWLSDKASWRLAWLAQNSWFGGFLPVAAAAGQAKLANLASSSEARTWLERSLQLLEGSGEWLNYVLYWLETRYRWLRYHEAVPPMTQAFFHTPAVRSRIYQQWQRSLATLGLLS